MLNLTSNKLTWINLLSLPAIEKSMKLPGTATQAENIDIAMGKLGIQKGDLFLDIGCGSGAVSLAASSFTNRIYGIDLRPEAVEASRSLVPGGTFFEGEAREILPGLPEIDKCFIGGTRGIDDFFPLLLERAKPGCIVVADLARVGVASKVSELMKKAGVFQELLQICIFHGYDLAGDIALKPVNPIFMVVGRC
jgi:cobalt-precorrin-6B (C15)-methyltransferase